jgi:hypothetical protein
MLTFGFIGHSGRAAGVVFTGAHGLGVLAKAQRADFLELLNRLNSDLHSRMMTCCSADPKGFFVVQAFYLGPYRKTDFPRFFELFAQEALKIMDHPDLQEYLK